MKKIQLAVRDFALPVPRSGSIEVHSGYGSQPQLGQEIHLRVQQRQSEADETYQAEVPIRYTFERDGYAFVVSGRMDGFFPDESRIEEIKSASNIRDLRQRLSESPDHPYRLQLLVYAWIHRQCTGTTPLAQLHLVSTRTFESDVLNVSIDWPWLEAWLDRRIDELVAETKIKEKTVRRRKRAAKDIEFPFARPRSGQLELLATVEKAVEAKEPLMIQAPTGLGKTVGVLYPVLREALSRGQKVVYVTPKNSQHTVAEEAMKQFQTTGAKVKALTVNAKSRMCMKAEPLCNPDYCEYAKDYYTKVAEHGLVEKICKAKNLTPRRFRDFGEKYQVCPFELQLETLDRVDAVICDYNYVFAPRSALGRLSLPMLKKENKPNLVIDEAHNLPSRAMDYYSPSLSSLVLRQLRTELGELPKSLRSEALSLVDGGLELIENVRPEGCSQAVKVNVEPFPFREHEQQMREFLTRYLEDPMTVVRPRDPVIRLANYWSEFAMGLDFEGFEGNAFFTTYRPHPSGGTLRITCCDASEPLREGYKSFAHVTAFSATLKPFDYYARLSGLNPENLKMAEFLSPFGKNQRKLLVIPQVSTKYSHRRANTGKISEAIRRIVSIRPGNYFVFFPSFEFMESVASVTRPDGFEIRTQAREMKPADVRDWINALKSADPPKLVFAVQGGVFSEGVDYPGDMVIGAIIVGPALPTFDLERETLREYYEKRYGSGFDYAYTFPAMAKSVQAAGRVIRSESDRGLIVLMDNRFLDPGYVKSMPADWFDEHVRELVSHQILSDIKEFWHIRDEGEEVLA